MNKEEFKKIGEKLRKRSEAVYKEWDEAANEFIRDNCGLVHNDVVRGERNKVYLVDYCKPNTIGFVPMSMDDSCVIVVMQSGESIMSDKVDKIGHIDEYDKK